MTDGYKRWYFIIGSERQVIRQLKIDRDTMTECTMLGYLGSPIGTKEMQISLAHGFGDGKEESCEYAREAVEGLLLGEKIRASEQFTADLYDALQPYLVTDMARGRIINETWNARAYPLEEPCQNKSKGEQNCVRLPDAPQRGELVPAHRKRRGDY